MRQISKMFQEFEHSLRSESKPSPYTALSRKQIECKASMCSLNILTYSPLRNIALIHQSHFCKKGWENKATKFILCTVFLLGKVFLSSSYEQMRKPVHFFDHTHIQNRCSPICLTLVQKVMVMPD